MKRYKTVDEYIDNSGTFQSELIKLREILNSTELDEEVKWGGPCYTHEGKMVVGLGAFKEHFALWFYQGALLADKEGVLVSAQEGKTKALRQWRMTSKKDIKTRSIKAYVREAILLQSQGKEIKPTRGAPVEVPQELSQALRADKAAEKSFAGLTTGKQREYATHIADAKRAETKQKRIAKIIPMIKQGIGLHDKYRNC